MNDINVQIESIKDIADGFYEYISENRNKYKHSFIEEYEKRRGRKMNNINVPIETIKDIVDGFYEYMTENMYKYKHLYIEDYIHTLIQFFNNENIDINDKEFIFYNINDFYSVNHYNDTNYFMFMIKRECRKAYKNKNGYIPNCIKIYEKGDYRND